MNKTGSWKCRMIFSTLIAWGRGNLSSEQDTGKASACHRVLNEAHKRLWPRSQDSPEEDATLPMSQCRI
jgi:hypothetical protein